MAEPTDTGPVALDPELTTNLTRLLQIRGPLGLLRVLDTIVPVVSMGDVVSPTITVLQPAFRSTDIFSAGAQLAAAVNTVHADTTGLAAGTYDVVIIIQSDPADLAMVFQIQHRNAANAANLAQWDIVPRQTGGIELQYQMEFGYEIALNERLRVLNLTVIGAGQPSVATIFARLRT